MAAHTDRKIWANYCIKLCRDKLLDLIVGHESVIWRHGRRDTGVNHTYDRGKGSGGVMLRQCGLQGGQPVRGLHGGLQHDTRPPSWLRLDRQVSTRPSHHRYEGGSLRKILYSKG
jgi:hypothetical protein